jgi:hypothetical protein
MKSIFLNLLACQCEFELFISEIQYEYPCYFHDYFDWLKNLTYFGRWRQEIPKKDISYNNDQVYGSSHVTRVYNKQVYGSSHVTRVYNKQVYGSSHVTRVYNKEVYGSSHVTRVYNKHRVFVVMSRDVRKGGTRIREWYLRSTRCCVYGTA